MMSKQPFWKGSSPERQVNKLWKQALSEPDPEKSLELLRDARWLLRAHAAALAHLWPSFLDAFLDRSRLHRLTQTDFMNVEEMATALASGFARPLRPEDIWLRLLPAYTALGQEQRVRDLLPRMYSSPSATWEEKAYCARDLARRGEMSEQALQMYLDYLQKAPVPAAETDIIQLLNGICAVDFNSDRAALERARVAAQQMMNARSPVPVAGLWTALALHTLLVQRAPHQALTYFGNAFNANQQDRTAMIGLLACYIQLGQHGKIGEMARQPFMSGFARDAVVAGLLQFSGILNWLDDQNVMGPLPGNTQTVESLRNLGLRAYLGDIVDGTIGRLYLLAGDARQAVTLLSPLLANQQYPQWAYYAAWAGLLTGNRDGVAACFDQVARWPGRWAVACLLIDADPAQAERSGAFAFLRGAISSSMQVRQCYLPLIQARLALALSQPPAPAMWKRDTSSIEEDMEALRTIIGYTCYTRNLASMERWLTHPLFTRLPLPDQLLWRGLYGLSSKDQAPQGLALLDEAATRYGYYRAALVLTLHYLEKYRFKEAKRYLRMAEATRHDGKTTLLRAYIAAREGEKDAAIKQLEQAAAESSIEAKASFVAGNLWLQKASEAAIAGQSDQIQSYRTRAVEHLSSALQIGRERLPDHAEALLRCARFVAQPDQQSALGASLWNELERLEPPQRQDWLKWNAVLGRLWYGCADDVIAVANEVAPIIDTATGVEEHVAAAFAQALAAVSTRAEQTDHMEQLLRLLERFSTHSQLAPVRQACQAGITLTLREHYEKADEQQRYQLRQELMRRATIDRSNDALALLLATASIEHGAKLAAINTLRKTRSPQASTRALFPYLADMLDRSGQITHAAPEPEPGSSAAVQRAYEALHIAEAFATQQPERGFELLNTLLRQHGSELGALVRIGRLLPHLCVYATRSGGAVPQALADMVRSFTNAPMDGEQRALLARCASAIGEMELAESLWEQALTQGAALPMPLRQEYAKFLSYRAVNAHLANDDREAARYLRLAASSLNEEAGS